MYDLLYSTKSVNYVELDRCLAGLLDSMPIDSNRIKIEKNLAGSLISVKAAVPVGLIVSELVTNSIKHAFPGRETGSISLSLQDKKDFLRLKYQDSGPGPPEGFSVAKTGSPGFTLMQALSSQIGGGIEFGSGSGFICFLNIPVGKESQIQISAHQAE